MWRGHVDEKRYIIDSIDVTKLDAVEFDALMQGIAKL